MNADLERAPCERCGATTIVEAETRCQPSTDESGEYYCAVPDDHVDAEGYLMRETAEAIARRDAWVDAELDRMEAERLNAEAAGR